MLPRIYLDLHWNVIGCSPSYACKLQKQALVVDMMELIFCSIHKMIVQSDMLSDVPVEQVSLSSACMLNYLNYS